jgi:hypothetical protein
VPLTEDQFRLQQQTNVEVEMIEPQAIEEVDANMEQTKDFGDGAYESNDDQTNNVGDFYVNRSSEHDSPKQRSGKHAFMMNQDDIENSSPSIDGNKAQELYYQDPIDIYVENQVPIGVRRRSNERSYKKSKISVASPATTVNAKNRTLVERNDGQPNQHRNSLSGYRQIITTENEDQN